MAVTASQVVAQLEKHLGQNGSYYWNKYNLPRGTAYCAASVSASFADAGAKDKFYDGKPVFYVPYAQQWLKKHCKHVPLSDVRRGDIIIFTWDGNGYNKERGSRDHIGFARARSTGNTLYTVEGNTNGGKVAKRDRPAKYIYGVYRPNMKSGGDEPAKDEKLVVDGDFGYETKCRLQKWLGVAEDGEIGKKTVKALQKKIGVADVDGAWGQITTKKLQKYLDARGYNCAIDGVIGEQTIKALQKFLNAVFFGGNIDVVKKPSSEVVADPQPTVDKFNLNKVIDISAWQGQITKSNFKKAMKDGVKAVILRSSYTTQVGFNLHKDKVFAYNYKKAIAAGLPIGVYHYSQATTVSEAKKEAQYVLSIIKGLTIKLPVAFDWEFGGRLNAKVAKKNGKAGNKKICNAFCKIIKDAGYDVMVYANLSTFNNDIEDDIYKSWKIWIAQYNKTCDYKHKYYLWQYTSSGKVDGLSGRIDMNKG